MIEYSVDFGTLAYIFDEYPPTQIDFALERKPGCKPSRTNMPVVLVRSSLGPQSLVVNRLRFLDLTIHSRTVCTCRFAPCLRAAHPISTPSGLCSRGSCLLPAGRLVSQPTRFRAQCASVLHRIFVLRGPPAEPRCWRRRGSRGPGTAAGA
jgi:hypothetical protein